MRRVRSTGALLVNSQCALLLQLRDDKPGLLFPNHWTTFGGAVEAGESPDQTIVRELLEEIHLQPALTLWKTYEHIQHPRGEPVMVEQYLYTGRIDLPLEAIEVHEGQRAGYFRLEELADLRIAFGFRPYFEEFLTTYDDCTRRHL
jgi:8-oxo-dGTP diphosphatase